MANDMQVAQTIFQQLGGGRFSVMTGSKDYVGGPDFLMFKFGSGAAHGINKIRVTLMPSDTYRVEFFRIRGTKVTVIETLDDIYCDVLADSIGRVTGFAVRF